MPKNIENKKIILISPFSKKLRDGRINPKNYPYWREVIKQLKKDKSILLYQVGVDGEDSLDCHKFYKNKPLKELKKMIEECKTWISVDNFFHHLVAVSGEKPGVVIFSQSDPDIFGYKNNLNLLKDKSCLRPDQFQIWEHSTYNKNYYIESYSIVEAVNKLL